MKSYPIGSPEDESKQGNPLPDSDFQKIREIYEQQLTIPTQRGPKIFLCPVGLVGAGKSTVLKPLVAHFHLVRVSGDEIRKLLGKHGYNHIRTVEMAFDVINKLIQQGYGVAIDSDCAGKNVSKTVDDMARKHGYKTLYIHINPPEAFILNKLKSYKHTWLFKDADDAIQSYFRRKPLHQKLDYPFVYSFDSSKQDLPIQIEQGIKAIETKIG